LNNKISRINFHPISHIFLVILLSVVVSVAIFNTTVLSKNNIMGIIDYSLTLINTDISPVDTIFIARLIRQQLWQIHFWVGILLPFMSLLVFWLYKYKKNKDVFFIVGVIVYLAIIGVLLFLRSYYNFTEETFLLLKDLHWIGVWLFGFGIFYHVFKILIIKDVQL